MGSAALVGGLITLYRCRQSPELERPDFRVALPFLLSGLLGAWGGARPTHALPELVLKVLFGLMVVAAASAMVARALAPEGRAVRARELPLWLAPLLGGLVGLLTGLVGVGGGFMIVPALTVIGRLSLKRASATSVWIIAGNAAAALVGYLGHVTIAWGVAGGFFAVTLLAMQLGQRLAQRVPARALQLTFATFLLVVGILTLLKH